MAVWRRKESAKATTAACYVRAIGDGGSIPKGFVPVVLVGNEEDGEERGLAHVAMLKEPCMVALLEMAAQQFGYGQQGVLRIPCDTRRFEQIINMTCRAK